MKLAGSFFCVLLVNICAALYLLDDAKTPELREGQLGFGADCYLHMDEKSRGERKNAEFKCATTEGTVLKFTKLQTGRYFISAGKCPLFWTRGWGWNIKRAVFRCGTRPRHGFWIEKQPDGAYAISAKVGGKKCPLFQPGGAVKGVATVSTAQFRCGIENESFWIRASLPGPATTTAPEALTSSAPVPEPLGYAFGSPGSVKCPLGYSLVTDQRQCKRQVTKWSKMEFDVASCWRFGAVGCFTNTRNKLISFSTCKHPKGTAAHHAPVCQLTITFGTPGTVTCPPGYSLITDQQQCETEVTAWSKMEFDVAGCWRLGAVGCFTNTRNKLVSFSTCKHPKGTATHHTPVCQLTSPGPATTPAIATTAAEALTTSRAEASKAPSTAAAKGSVAPSTAAAEASKAPSTAAAKVSKAPSTAAAEASKAPSTAEADASKAPSTAAAKGSRTPSTVAAKGSRTPSTVAGEPSKAPSTAAAEGTKAPSTAAAEDTCINDANTYRNLHTETPAITSDSQLYSLAQGYAEKLLKKVIGEIRAGGKASLEHDPNNRRDGTGENLYYANTYEKGGIETFCKRADKSWYNEIKDYSFTTHKSTNGEAIGHFTQMVWKGSKKVGYGYAAQQHPNFPNNRVIIVVAKYTPAGNVVSRYGQNVMPLK